MRFTTAIGIAVGAGVGCMAAARALRARRAIEFSGTTVVIFGGSRGLGLALAREFAGEGAHVVLAARDENELARAAADIEGRGGAATTIACDLEDRDQIERTIQRIVHDRGAIDVLVNNAGIIQVGPLEHMSLEDFEHAMRDALLGAAGSPSAPRCPTCARPAARPHRQHLVDRRQDRGAAPAALLRQQVRAHRLLRRAARRAGAAKASRSRPSARA